MDTLLLDLRYALRFLRKRPLFTLVAVLSLAIGVGANTAIFGAAHALLIRPPGGVGEAERVVEVGRTSDGDGFDSFSYPDLLDLREQAAPLESLAGWKMDAMSVSLGGAGERVLGMAVSANYFSTLGVPQGMGRYFLPEEDTGPGAHPVAVVSHRFWTERLERDAEAVGRTILVNRHPFTVVGVAPEEFIGHVAAIQPSVYVPMMMMNVVDPGFNALDSRRSSWFQVIGRLAPGATVEEADAAVRTVFDGLREAYLESNATRGAKVLPMGPIPGGGRGPAAAFLGMLLALSGVLLLVTCANLAGMLLARAAAREREIAIRLALGSGRGRLIRQLVTESVALFVVGGVAGVAAAIWAMMALSKISIPAPVPVELSLQPDGTVLAFGLGVALIAGILSGMAPAWQSSRPDLVPALKDAGAARRSSRGRMRRGFVMGQVGLSVLLLVAAGLFLRALQRAGTIDPGFVAEDVQLVSFNLELDGYGEEEGRRFQGTLLERVRALPGVEAASLSLDQPMDLSTNESPVFPAGWTAERGMRSGFNMVTSGYFETLRIRVLQGRGFGEEDRAGAPGVVVVSRELAEKAWPGQSALGKRIRHGSNDPQKPELTVVGVVADVKNATLTEETMPMVYRPYAQEYQVGAGLLVRSSGGSQAGPMLRELRAMDPRLSHTPVLSLEEHTSLGLLPQRLAAWVTGALGLLALLLSGLGVYGVVAYGVAQRVREIGIRLALGAQRADVLKLIVRGGLGMALPGLALGAAAAFALSRLLRAFLLGVPPGDPLTYAAVTAVLMAAVLLASVLPARRAARTDPMVALRAE